MNQSHTRFAHPIILAAIVALLALALAACAQAPAAPAQQPAQQAQATAAPAAKQAEAPTAAPKAAQPTSAPAAAQPTAASASAGGASGALPKLQGDKFVYWGGLIFSDKANKMFEERVKEWGKQRNIPVEVVMVNQNETVQKVSAAIQAGNAPDAFDLGRDFMLQLNTQNQLVPMDDVYKKIGDAHGGWLDPVAKATDPKTFNGKIPGIPFGVGGNVLFRRTDALKAGGFDKAPDTWEDLSKQAAASQKPPKTYGMGFALSNVGDGNLTTQMMQSWGGRVADDTGKKCTIDSPETRAFLKWITDAYAQNLFPPGVTTWDGAGDNNAYQSGQALFIANTGSVSIWMQQNDKELLDATKYSVLPAGPKTRISTQNPQYRGIWANSKNKELAKDLMEFLADDKFMADYYANAIYGPVLKSQQSAPIFQTSEVHKGLADLAVNGTAPAYPDVDNAAFAEYQNNFLTPKMVQKIVVDKKSIDDAIKETQAACQTIYDKYNK